MCAGNECGVSAHEHVPVTVRCSRRRLSISVRRVSALQTHKTTIYAFIHLCVFNAFKNSKAFSAKYAAFTSAGSCTLRTSRTPFFTP